MKENQSIQCTVIYSESDRALSTVKKIKEYPTNTLTIDLINENELKMPFSQLITDNISYECLQINLIIYLDISEKKILFFLGTYYK